MSSAIDDLCRLLDEQGVEWTDLNGTVSFAKNERQFHAWAHRDDTLRVAIVHLTPEQAIAATLGRGTCHKAAFCTCSVCGASLDGIYGRYCPNCGRKVIDE